MTEPDFESFSTDLQPVLQSLEEKRKELKAKGSKQGLRVGLILFAIAITIVIYCGFEWFGWFISALLAFATYLACINMQSSSLSAFYKEKVVVKIIQLFCTHASFSPRQGIDRAVFQNTLLFTAPDRYHTEDLIEGRIDKTDFMCAEIHAEERKTQVTKNGSREYWVDIFKGFLFVADFHKDFRGITVIHRDSFLKMGSVGSRVKLENPGFEKCFDVYSTDQVEARYLITPSMMERILELNNKLGGDIKISFRDSKVFIAIPDSGNHFEASIWHSIEHLGQLEKEFRTIRSLLSIVSELNLNTRIWSKD